MRLALIKSPENSKSGEAIGEVMAFAAKIVSFSS